jgi:tetratricopeptide (TPR) repeat protein
MAVGSISLTLIEAASNAMVSQSQVGLPLSDQAAGSVMKTVLVFLRAIAKRDSLLPAAYRTVLEGSENLVAVSHLIEGQRHFARSQFDDARSEFRAAIREDSMSLLARARLSAAESADWRLEEAYDLAEEGLRLGVAGQERGHRLLRAHRHFAARQADSAISEFQRSINDDSDNIDGWYGLGISLYFMGWVAGQGLADARYPLERVVDIDPGFSYVYPFLVDASLAGNAVEDARRFHALIPPSDQSKRAKELAISLASRKQSDRASVLGALRGETRFTLSELFLISSRILHDSVAADVIGEELMRTARPPEDRLRGAHYRLTVAKSLARVAEAVRDVQAAAPPGGFDGFLASAALAAATTDSAAVSLVASATRTISTASDAQLLTGDARQGMDYLVQNELLRGTARTTTTRLERAVQIERSAHPANPVPPSWRLTLQAKLSLLRGDTSTAIALLTRSVSRIDEPSAAFFPLAAQPVARNLLAELFTRTARTAEARRVASTFQRSWSLTDALYSGSRLSP